MVDESRLQTIFEAWLAGREEDGDPDIAMLCEGDEELEEAFRARIAVYEAIDPALGVGQDDDDGNLTVGTEWGAGPGAGAVIGNFRLIQKLDEGGFAIVFVAERTDGYAERVAVKVLKRGVGSVAGRVRFAGEAQALALVRHPNIASVLDAGVADDGVPYLVMDLIDGVPLGEFCRSHELPVRQRLELMLAVCEAVGHAHAKGVIHRDLKPANVLVSEVHGKPVPKVIDFGISRITDPLGDAASRVTREGEFVGTVAYMSPEQLGVLSEDADTRSDIYSFGVMLYEILSGVLPYQKNSGDRVGLHELQQRMRQTDPQTLASRLQSGSAGVDAGSSSTRTFTGISRELSWLVMKCLEIEPDRRYATCRELAGDIRRYFEGEPLIAGPPSAVYRMKKFVQRNRVGVGAGITATVLVIVAAAATVFGLVRAVEERKRAVSAEADTRLVAEFQADQLGSMDPDGMGIEIRRRLLDEIRVGSSAGDIDVKEMAGLAEEMLAVVNFTNIANATLEHEIFRPTIEAIASRFRERPDIRARLMLTVATAQEDAGLLEAAESSHRTALRDAEEAFGDDSVEAARALRELGNLLKAKTDASAAEEMIRQAMHVLRRELGDEHLDSLVAMNDLATVLSDLERTEEAESMLREALAIGSVAMGNDHAFTLKVHGNLGGILDQRDRAQEAEAHYRAALDGLRRVSGNEHSDTILSINNLAVNLFRQGRVTESEPYFSEALVLSRRVLGDDHPSTLIAMANAALLLEEVGRTDEALALNRESFSRRERVLGRMHPSTLISMNNLTGSLRLKGEIQEAYTIGHDVLGRARASIGPRHWQTGIYQSNFARTVAAQGDNAEAARLMLGAHEILVDALGADHKRVHQNAGHLGRVYAAWDAENPGMGYDIEAKRWQRTASGSP